MLIADGEGGPEGICRVGSLEKYLSPHVAVSIGICRVGSLENYVEEGETLWDGICRVGSLETCLGSGPACRSRYLPSRQFRNSKKGWPVT